MAALTANAVPLQGLQLDALLAAASAGGDTAPTGAGVFLVVKNADASPHTVTLPIPQLIDGDRTITARAVAVAAAKTVFVPLTDRYRDPTTGLASLTYDAVTSVSVAVIRMAAS